MKERFPGAGIPGRFLLLLCAALFLGKFIYDGWDGKQNNYCFWQFSGRFLAILYLLKAFDIICPDRFLLTRSHFFRRYCPKTEGCTGYHSFGFNRKEQLTRIILFPFVSMLPAWICTVL